MLSFLNRDARRSLWQDLRTGEAGWVPRAALSLVSGVALVAIAMLILGIASQFSTRMVTYTAGIGGQTYTRQVSSVRDEHVAMAIFLALAVWAILLTRIWAAYRRFRKPLFALFGVLVIWGIVIPVCFGIDAAFTGDEEFLIAACVLAGIAATILWITWLWYESVGGKPMLDETGSLNLKCPHCEYSLVGLSEARCPECGQAFTLDELVLKQDYDVLRKPKPGRLRKKLAGDDAPEPTQTARHVEPPTAPQESAT